MKNNLKQIISLFKGKNPEQIVMDMAKNEQIKDPNIIQLIKYAQSGDNDNLQQLANSICKNRGMNFVDELNTFMSLLGNG